MHAAFSNLYGSLAERESIIERNRKFEIEIGLALWEIRQYRLYHQHGYLTFEEYCHDRWNLSGEAAQNLIDAVKILRL